MNHQVLSLKSGHIHVSFRSHVLGLEPTAYPRRSIGLPYHLLFHLPCHQHPIKRAICRGVMPYESGEAPALWPLPLRKCRQAHNEQNHTYNVVGHLSSRRVPLRRGSRRRPAPLERRPYSLKRLSKANSQTRSSSATCSGTRQRWMRWSPRGYRRYAGAATERRKGGRADEARREAIES